MAENPQNRPDQLKRKTSESVRPLNLYCVGQLESLLGVTREELKAFDRDRGSLYKSGLLVKPPLPFAKKRLTPKSRKLDKPAMGLSRIQKKIYRKLLAPLKLPDYIKGGIRGQSTLQNLT